MKKLVLLTLALVLALFAMPLLATDATWSGWITDEHCGAKGAKAGHADCALKCIKDGGSLLFYNSADQKLYKLDNQEAAKANLGHEVKVTGTVEGDAIKVASIAKADA